MQWENVLHGIMILSPMDLSRMNTLFARVQDTLVFNAKGPETNYTVSLVYFTLKPITPLLNS